MDEEEREISTTCIATSLLQQSSKASPLTYVSSVSCILYLAHIHIADKTHMTHLVPQKMNNPCRQPPTDADEMPSMATEPTPKKSNGRKRARVVTKTTARSPSPIPKQPAVLGLDLPVPCAGSVLGDDLILCRLSALLPPTTDLERPQLNAAAAAANASSRSASAGSSSRSSASASNGSRSTSTTTSRRRHRRSASTTSASSAEGNDTTDTAATADTTAAAGGDTRRTTRSGRTTLRRPTNTKGAKSSARDLAKSSLVRKVSSTLTDEEDSNNGSNTCSKGGGGGGGGGTSFSLIPGDVAVVLPPELRHPSEISSSSSSTAGSFAGGNGNRNRNNTATASAASTENSDSDIHSPTTTNTTSTPIDNPLQHLLRSVGIEEVEALDPTNGGPTAGQCQFACVATALSRSYGTGGQGQPLLRDDYRPDLELRRLALHVIRMNPELYRNFLTVAGGRTRKHSAAGGSGVDLEAYLRTMANPSCDGDAVTLQALCDALKITVRIVKPVAADTYDEERQQRLLQEYYAGVPVPTSAGAESSAAPSSTPTDVCSSSDEEGYATAIEDDDDVDDDDLSSTSSLATAYSSLSWSDNPYSACTGIQGHRHVPCVPQDTSSSSSSDSSSSSSSSPSVAMMDMDPTSTNNPAASPSIRQRLYVSQEIRPRRLDRVDTRIRDVQRTTRGRLLWLSHIGDEAHYRFLRPCCSRRSTCAMASDCPHGPVNEEEATIARRSQEARRRHLTALLRSREDGYVRSYRPQGRARSASMDKSSAAAAGDATPDNIVSIDKLQRLKKLLCTTANGEGGELPSSAKRPRCGLCFQDFFDSAYTGTSSARGGVGMTASSSTNSPSKQPSMVPPGSRARPPASPTRSSCSAVSPSGCNHDFCSSCIQTWVAANDAPTCPTCGLRFCDLIDQNQRVVRTVTPPPPIENGITCVTISNENAIVLSTSKDEKLQHRQQETSTALIPPALPSYFSWAEAMSPSNKGLGGKVPPTIMSFNRQMLAEVSHELRFGEQMESPMDLCRRMGQVASMVDGPQLENLLGANVLRTLRVLITPTTTESAIRNIEVAIPGVNSNRYVVSGDIFRAVLAIIERINQKSRLSIESIHDSLDLPKMLLWYMSCPELRSLEGYVEGLAAAKRVIGSWSKLHSLTIVDALGNLEAAERKALEAKRKAARAVAAAARPPPAKKQKLASASSSSTTAPKKIPPVKKPVPPGPPRPPIVRVLPKLPPPALISRGAGKRKIRPPAIVNISAADLSMRDWRT